jgi:hypothetical protein
VTGGLFSAYYWGNREIKLITVILYRFQSNNNRYHSSVHINTSQILQLILNVLKGHNSRNLHTCSLKSARFRSTEGVHSAFRYQVEWLGQWQQQQQQQEQQQLAP